MALLGIRFTPFELHSLPIFRGPISFLLPHILPFDSPPALETAFRDKPCQYVRSGTETRDKRAPSLQDLLFPRLGIRAVRPNRALRNRTAVCNR